MRGLREQHEYAARLPSEGAQLLHLLAARAGVGRQKSARIAALRKGRRAARANSFARLPGRDTIAPMTQDVELSCRCGEVHGWLKGVSPSTVNRAICYCDDCQAFAHHIGRADILDAKGGTDVVQVAPRSLSFDKGAERIVGLRLSPKGLHRWYASCCKTPLGNTFTPAMPFVGIVPEALLGTSEQREQLFGKVRGAIFGQYAIGGAPPGSTKMSFGLMAHTMKLLLGWKLGGKAWPHPFFDRSGAPSRPVTVLSQPERELLRAKCGPKPAAAAPPS